MILKIKKRDGRIVDFDQSKITNAIHKALIAVLGNDKLSKQLSDQVTRELNNRFKVTPSVEDIQDIVENVLVNNKLDEVAKAYILYRARRARVRELKQFLRVSDDLKLGINAIRVMEKRYLQKDEKGHVIETPKECFLRVAKAVSQIDKRYGIDSNKSFNEFFEVMSNLLFLPNSPTLMNAGTRLGQLAACFTGEQSIITSNGMKPIRDIKIGDCVLTASGKFAFVTETMQRLSKGRYIINVKNLPNNTLSVTEEHPILSLIDGKPAWVMAKNLRKGDYVAISYPKEVNDINEIAVIDFLSDNRFVVRNGLVHRKNIDRRLRCGEISLHVRPIKNKLIIDSDFLRLLGYYASEGDIDGTDCVRFTFSAKEINYAKDVLGIINKKFGLSSRIERSNHGNWINVKFHSYTLTKFFANLMGNGFNTKFVPKWILTLPHEKQKGFIIGAFRGDSTLFLNRHVHNARLVMCNYNLVYAAWVILLRIGKIPRLYYEKIPKLGKTIPYCCTINASDSADLIEEIFNSNINSPTQMNMQRKTALILGDRIFLPIKDSKFIDEDTMVYNFEVEGEHTYVANGVAVHNCFVLPVQDSLESIFETIKNTALIHQSGGGTGFNFSRLRPNGDVVKSTGGIASGPVSFMRVFDMTTEVIKQGGRRRGANMGILRVDHPDIIEFINSKQKPDSLNNFNISVAVTDQFMKAVKNNSDYCLVNPRNNELVRRVNAREVFELIVNNAWRTGDPGLIFIDEINRHNPTPHLGPIESTNPCGEQTLLPYESCNLGSINLSRMVKDKKVDWDLLRSTVHTAVHFLDNVIDANKFPLNEIERLTKANRKIGLGVMGLADMMIKLGIRYNSNKALFTADKIIKFIKKESIAASAKLALKRGSFPNFKRSVWKTKVNALRNATLLTIAPTGSISIIAGCSSGIEPLFAISFIRKVLEGTSLLEVNELFELESIKKGFHSDNLMKSIAATGSIKGTKLPDSIKKLFVTAMDISPEWHVRMQSIFQKHVDNAVSKTINFPYEAGIDDVRRAYLLAHKLKCKGITVYRYGSKPEQVLYFSKEKEYVTAESDYAGGCPTGLCPF